jgi:hypothetical protein
MTCLGVLGVPGVGVLGVPGGLGVLDVHDVLGVPRHLTHFVTRDISPSQ